MGKRCISRIHKVEMRIIKTKEEITLIALVITIIVLLILAAISIATLTGQNGILSRADDAKRENEIASVKEQARLDISNYVAEKLINGEDSTVNTPEKVQEILDGANAEENRYYAGYTETGVKTPNGYEVPYEELYTTGSSGEGTTSKTVEDLVVGDKVYYDTGNTSIGDKGIIECVVLYDKAYNEAKGTNYGIQIIASDVVCDVTLGYNDPTTIGNTNFEKAKYSYDNVISTLNKKALEYLNAEYVREARCVGTAPNNKNDEKYDIDYNQMNKVGSGIANIGKTYWMGSHDTDGAAGTTYYRVYFINSSGGLEYNSLYSVNSLAGSNVGNTYTNGFRPVFTLNSDINIINGDGVNTPYTLENKN